MLCDDVHLLYFDYQISLINLNDAKYSYKLTFGREKQPQNCLYFSERGGSEAAVKCRSPRPFCLLLLIFFIFKRHNCNIAMLFAKQSPISATGTKTKT